MGVQFQVNGLNSMMLHLQGGTLGGGRGGHQSSSSAANSLLSSRAICAALGNIFLELFSMGKSSSPGTSTSIPPNNNNTAAAASRNNHSRHQGILPPAAQRRKTANDSLSDSVDNILIEVSMPLAVRRLVCDLMDAISQPLPDSAFTSVDDVLWDLTRMKDDPQRFLFDRTCPRRALEDTCLFQSMDKYMFGRERELSILMDTKERICRHVRGRCGHLHIDSNLAFGQDIDFKCEKVFLSGYAGSGKSALLHALSHRCAADGWFVLGCKYDKKLDPFAVMAGAWNEWFGIWASANDGDSDPAMRESFKQVCHTIHSTMDKEGLSQLYELIPNVLKVFPDVEAAAMSHNKDQGTSSSIGIVGSANKRRVNLFHALFKSICSAGRPVLIIYDDLQWAHAMEGMKDFIINYHSIPCAVPKGSCQHGMMIVSSFRSNEVGQNEGIIKTITDIDLSKSAKVTGLEVGELSQGDITKLLSSILCLPFRYTKELAGLVLTKTRGNPFFIVQFLKSIVQNGMLSFSVEQRGWSWDLDIIDMQMISEGVAELLTTRFNQLPEHLMTTLKIASCFGSQVDSEALDVLGRENNIQFEDALNLAIKEGILEKAGPIYQFTHDIIQQTIYGQIHSSNLKPLHKNIGEALLKSANNNPTIHFLAVDQINIFCEDGVLSTEERSLFSKANATAAKFAIEASSFEQARSYVNAGMKLLDANHWEQQYSLSLDLYEMSASVSCIFGDIGDMSNRLTEIIANVKSFEDSLTASSLLSKVLAASSKYDEAIGNCLSVLSTLGEEFPEDVDLPIVENELAVIQTTLANISVEKVKLLPPMTDRSKLHSMKFLSMLCSYCIQSKPLLVPLLACRMVRLTIENGFCDDSIVGLVTAGYGLFSFTDDIKLGYQIGKVGEAMIEKSQKMHALRSRLCFELDSTLKAVVEPMQSAVSECSNRHDSALLAGDITSSMMSLMAHCIGSLHIGMELTTLSKMFVNCIKRSTQYQHNFVTCLAMSSFGLCTYLSGQDQVDVDVKSYDELNMIGRQKSHLNLLYQNFFNEMSCYFWMRDYLKVVEFTEQFKPTGHERILEVMRTFFEGIACLTLARHTRQHKWRKIGEEALEKMQGWTQVSKWNFENMSKLLEAELFYLNGDFKSAKEAYKASIESATSHKFIHYEALAYELYGIFCIESMFCIENQVVGEGVEQLRLALKKYKQWGAMRKVKSLQRFIDLVDPTQNKYLMLF